MKIVYCLNSISHLGGIAKVTIMKANALAEIEDNEIYICVSDYKENEISSKLSPKVKLINLNINYYKDDWKSKWHLLKSTTIKRSRHKRELSKALNFIKPDIVVSVGQSEKYFITEIKRDWNLIREFHFNSDYRNFTADTLLKKIVNWLVSIYDLKFRIRGFDHMVVLTKEDKERNWKNKKNISIIPNPLMPKINLISSTLNQKKIITIGRFEEQKNISSLIRAFSIVVKVYPDWILEIYGEGSQRQQLSEQISNFQLEDNIKLMGISMEPEVKMKEASVFVLSSKFEGFGLVIIEAMACGVPVVSYDCPCGPKDIISNGIDGFLVPLGNEKKLAEKIIYLIEHPDFRRKMGVAAVDKSKKYTLDKIIPLWMSLFQSLISN